MKKAEPPDFKHIKKPLWDESQERLNLKWK